MAYANRAVPQRNRCTERATGPCVRRHTDTQPEAATRDCLTRIDDDEREGRMDENDADKRHCAYATMLLCSSNNLLCTRYNVA